MLSASGFAQSSDTIVKIDDYPTVMFSARLLIPGVKLPHDPLEVLIG